MQLIIAYNLNKNKEGVGGLEFTKEKTNTFNFLFSSPSQSCPTR